MEITGRSREWVPVLPRAAVLLLLPKPLQVPFLQRRGPALLTKRAVGLLEATPLPGIPLAFGISRGHWAWLLVQNDDRRHRLLRGDTTDKTERSTRVPHRPSSSGRKTRSSVVSALSGSTWSRKSPSSNSPRWMRCCCCRTRSRDSAASQRAAAGRPEGPPRSTSARPRLPLLRPGPDRLDLPRFGGSPALFVLRVVEDSLPEQVKACAAIHLALERQRVD